MRAAPNLDPAYIARIRGDLSATSPPSMRATLYPFFLDGVAGEAGMVQGDGMHPTFGGVKTIVTRILPTIKRALAKR